MKAKKIAWRVLEGGRSSVNQGGDEEVQLGVQGDEVKLSSLSESNDTFLSFQALLNLHYLFGGFLDYLWSCELNISNFGPADRCGIINNALTRSGLIHSFHLKASATKFAFLGCEQGLELHTSSVLAVRKLILGFLPRYTSCFSRRCPILNCFNLGGVNVNSLTANHFPET
nr:hypothetical protein [Tanacetum cinerariifolium]